MAGPWEKYAAPEPETPAGPWAKYAPAQTQPKTSVPLQGISGVNEGLAGFVGSPVEAAKGMATFGPVSTVKSLTDKVLGWLGMSEHAEAFDPLNAGGRKALDAAENAIPNPVGGVGQVAGAMQDAGMISDVPPQNFPQRMARRVGQEIGANAPAALGVAALPGKLGAGARASFPSYMAADTAISAGSGAGAGLAEEAFPGNPTAEIIGQLAGGGIVGGAMMLPEMLRGRGDFSDIPSVETMKGRASSLYDQARATGDTIPQPDVAKLVVDIEGIAKAEGLITPLGTVNRAFSKASETIRQLQDYLTAPLGPDEVQTVKKMLQNVAESSDPNEARIGSLMLQRYHQTMEQSSPLFREADRYYRLSKKGETVQRLLNLAELKKSKFSQSGLENALRDRFRNFAERIENGTEYGWTPEEIAAIERVATSEGDKLQKFARDIGKMAPRGVVSVGVGGGLPFLVGNSFGGPMMGTLTAGSAMLAGEGGNRLATALHVANANRAAAMARSGQELPFRSWVTPRNQALATALMAGAATPKEPTGPR